jgi:hypothetical protein
MAVEKRAPHLGGSTGCQMSTVVRKEEEEEEEEKKIFF